MAVMEKEIELNVPNDQRFREFIKNSTAAEVCDFIVRLGNNISDDFIANMKEIAFMKFEMALGISRHYFRSNNSKRYRTELYVEPSNNKVLLFISLKDSRNEDAMRARLFDEHKDQLIKLLEESTKELDGSEVKELEISEILNDTDDLPAELKTRINKFKHKLQRRGERQKNLHDRSDKEVPDQ